MKRVWVMFACLVALSAPAAAQTEVLAVGNGAAVPHTLNEGAPSPGLDQGGIDLRVRIELPSYRSLPPEDQLHSVALLPYVPGSVRVKYRGLRGLAVKHISRRLRRYWGRSLDDLYEGDVIDYQELQQLHRERGFQHQDHRNGGRYWERRWFRSLPPEKGGIWKGTYQHEVGQTTEMLRIGAFSLNNEFRARIDRAVALSLFDADGGGRAQRSLGDRLASDNARLGRSFFDPDEDEEELKDRTDGRTRTPRTLAPPSHLDLWIGVEPTGNWFEGVHWRLKFRPGVRLRVSSRGLETGLKVRGILEVSLGRKKQQVIEVEGQLRWDPHEGEASAGVQVALMTW